jgi:hypothetical protein
MDLLVKLSCWLWITQARAMGMEEILQCAMDHADETFARQIQYILEQLLSDEVDDDDAEDEEEDEDVDVEVGDSQL